MFIIIKILISSGRRSKNQMCRWLKGNGVFWTWQDSYTHKFTVVVMQCTCKLKPDRSQCRGELDMKTHPWLREYWQFLGCERGRVIFSKSVPTDNLTKLWQKTTHPRIFRQHKLTLMGENKKGPKVVWVEKAVLDLGRVGGRRVTVIHTTNLSKY